jgi:hypothetical protein
VSEIHEGDSRYGGSGCVGTKRRDRNGREKSDDEQVVGQRDRGVPRGRVAIVLCGRKSWILMGIVVG